VEVMFISKGATELQWADQSIEVRGEEWGLPGKRSRRRKKVSLLLLTTHS
jgi:hypothetical protein